MQERARFELRADSFNTFNHTQFNAFNNTVSRRFWTNGVCSPKEISPGGQMVESSLQWP
jgi:hypothetical protein